MHWIVDRSIGYAYNRSHLVALRHRKISVSDRLRRGGRENGEARCSIGL